MADEHDNDANLTPINDAIFGEGHRPQLTWKYHQAAVRRWHARVDTERRLRLGHEQRIAELEAENASLITDRDLVQSKVFALNAELNRLNVENESLRSMVSFSRNRKLEAENERLRAALEGVSSAWSVFGVNPEYHLQCQVWLGRQWPTLHQAIMRVRETLRHQD